ncbi:MAG: hypothetical protein JSV23_02105 [Promethearchaeota archaeon]|nr:MAG: hypothetical protein JSV23_02105 [Candidatus Lokiarchaeota archaeon]
MALWMKIAKNEVRVRTSKFRKNRLAFFLVLYSFLIFWAFFLCPLIFDQFMPTLAGLEDLAPILVPAIAMIIEQMMMIFFIAIMIYPLSNIYRQTEIGFKEILLASPSTAGDIFLGEFLGKIPILFSYVFGIAPVFVNMLNPIYNLQFTQTLVIYGGVFGLVFLATLVGTIIMSWIEHKIAQSEKARDIAKALLMILSIGMVALIYSLQFGFQFIMDHPEFKNYLMWYPPLWFSNIILYTFNPTLINAYILNIWTSLALALLVPVITLYFSYKRADRFYTLEGGIEKVSSTIENENAFYKFNRRIIGLKWEGLVITQLKQFFRKKENISKLVYMGGITCVYGLIFSFSVSGAANDFISGGFKVMMVVFMGGMLYGIMLGNFIFVGSKDLLWVYKRSPRNVNSLVYSYIVAMLIINLILTIVITIFFTILFKFDAFYVVVFIIAYLSYGILVLFEAIGIQGFSPAFEEKGKYMGLNMFKLISLQMGVFTGFIFLMVWLSEILPEITTWELTPTILFISIHLVISLPLFFMGLRHLKKIE